MPGEEKEKICKNITIQPFQKQENQLSIPPNVVNGRNRGGHGEEGEGDDTFPLNPAATRLLDMEELDYIEKFLHSLSPSHQSLCLLPDDLGSLSLVNGNGVVQVTDSPGRPTHAHGEVQTRSPSLGSAMLGDSSGEEGEGEDNVFSPFANPDAVGRRPILDARDKRTRHIASEHKRRNRIKEEMQRMTILIPELSRSRVRISQARLLAHANDYIEALKGENDRLRTLLIRFDPNLR